ncbi:hypothetical protein K2173_000579 [Erythroxylum novogranatense]|uniref:Lipoxygenase n=1 Tax=Erythroxylum novogranatense TaxID=1862640 RepID=A0AAV8S804_9ROSI|nr:hypothetical protein K2173_000579 [Erythroxylum novogranatense]
MEHHRPCLKLQACINAAQTTRHTDLPALTTQKSTKRVIRGKIIVVNSDDRSGPGKSAYLQVHSATVVEPNTGKGKLSGKAYFKCGKSVKHDGIKTTTYKVKLSVDAEFEIPGAILVTNEHKHEFFLQSAVLAAPDSQIIHFDCRSWIYPTKKTKSSRIFFSITCYLPDQTPSGLLELRRSELVNLRGDGTRERKEWDRIYDYDCYDDLGSPDKGRDYIRPVLGGSRFRPYPRRGRTGLPSSNTAESRPEMINLDIYVPPDERFSPKKLAEVVSRSILAAVHFLIPEVKSVIRNDSNSFESFEEILDMFSRKRNQVAEGKTTEKMKKLLPDNLYQEITHASQEQHSKFPLPQIIAENEFAWMDDEEFARQMLAGTNPTRIQRLQKFPPEGKTGVSSIRGSHILHNLDGLTVNQAMIQRRIFILDHHDYLMPFLSRINKKDVCAYASRTLLFLRKDTTLKPIAVELSLPGSSRCTGMSWVFLPASDGTEAALWQLAKSHVVANDSAYHHLVSHWLHTHAVVEPFIIATRRQLSVMHPIHHLLDPHFKDTIHVNALSRTILINAKGILEQTLFTGEVSMELSSELYKEWRFDDQALPADLLKRGMAVKDPDQESLTGVKLLFQDYPYGVDGLDIWKAIKKWVRDFCSIFYEDDDCVKNDIEIQAWWSEIQNVGHGDKRNETWWYKMTRLSDLIEALTTLIWISSASHASVNYGQYAYAGYPPNRPMRCRKFIPEEGTLEFAEFLRDPDAYYLNMLPDRFEMTLSMALVEVLSQFSSDEQYLGQRPSEWIGNEEIQKIFEKFNKELRDIERKILERNSNTKFRNRQGPAKISYNLLCPHTDNVESKEGITGKGIPNSISI